MNDFTKEELEKIIKSIDGLVFSKFYADDTQLVYNKIQSMIDNYNCKHESDGLIYTSFLPQNKCKNCGEFYR